MMHTLNVLTPHSRLHITVSATFYWKGRRRKSVHNEVLGNLIFWGSQILVPISVECLVRKITNISECQTIPVTHNQFQCDAVMMHW